MRIPSSLRVPVALAAASVFAATALLGSGAAAQTEVIVRRGDAPFVQLFAWGGTRLGVTVRDVERADVEREKLPGAWGAVVEEVRGGSPAERGGLKAGDVIVEFDGERVRSARQFARLVQEAADGRAVPVVVVRAGQRMTLQVTPEAGEWPPVVERLERELDRIGREFRLRIRPELEWFRWSWPEPFAAPAAQPRRLGVVVQDLSPQLADYFGVNEGVLVTSVTPGSPAERAGVKAGDVITAVDGVSVARVADLQRQLLRQPGGREVSLTLVRDRKSLTVKATLDASGPAARRRIVSL